MQFPRLHIHNIIVVDALQDCYGLLEDGSLILLFLHPETVNKKLGAVVGVIHCGRKVYNRNIFRPDSQEYVSYAIASDVKVIPVPEELYRESFISEVENVS